MISVYKNHSRAFCYAIWNGDNFLGEVVEDDIMKLLNKEQVIDFYYRDKHSFSVDSELVKSYVEKPRSND